jgi:hypothetical protein
MAGTIRIDTVRREKLFRAGSLCSGAVVAGVVVACPLVGRWAAGREMSAVFDFPPRLSIPTDYPRFSWLAFALIVAPFAALAMTWRRAPGAATTEPGAGTFRVSIRHTRNLPGWGWAALAWTCLWWALAWTRFDWAAPVQRYTFFPLWLGFIVGVNALVQARSGSCLMIRAPRRWLTLFGASAAFWWVFEWLNRFSQNWHYLRVADFGPVSYAANATLCFSTVLPAVVAVRELLGTADGFQRACAGGPRLRWMDRNATGVALIVAGVVGLAGTGVHPEFFYPALWAAPLALVLGGAILASSPGRLSAEVASGDWRRVASWAVAALLCGFFWELWNVRSEAKWIYTVPYADRWHVFEMPLLGFLGYLPFGLECAVVANAVLGSVLESRSRDDAYSFEAGASGSRRSGNVTVYEP